MSPIVIVPKNNGKLRICVNLKKVNAAIIRDNYPLPLTHLVLERVSGKEAYSFLDGFFGFNQVLTHPGYQHKIAFAMEHGIFAFQKVPFWLTYAPVTFQRLMCHAFRDYVKRFFEIFMDDMCIHLYSNS